MQDTFQLILTKSKIKKELTLYSIYRIFNNVLNVHTSFQTNFSGKESFDKKVLTDIANGVSRFQKEVSKEGGLLIETLKNNDPVIAFGAAFNTLNPSAFKAMHKRLEWLEPLSLEEMKYVYEELEKVLPND